MTIRIPPDAKVEIIAALQEHIAKHGTQDYHLVRSRWPDYLEGPKGSAEERRFFRLVRAAQDFGKAPGDLKAEAVKTARGAVKRNVPAAPMPSTMYAMGASARAKLTLMAELDQLMIDGRMQRAGAVKVDEASGEERIKNAHLFNQSMQRRLDNIQAYLAIFREVYDLEQMKAFYEEIVAIIVEEIHPLDPVVSKRIIERLQALNDAQGMTMHARPPS